MYPFYSLNNDEYYYEIDGVIATCILSSQHDGHVLHKILPLTIFVYFMQVLHTTGYELNSPINISYFKDIYPYNT